MNIITDKYVMITSNSYNLDFGMPLLLDDIDPFLFPKIRHAYLSLDKINPKIIELFSNLSLDIILVEVFYSHPNFFSGIHADQTGGDINRINWIYGGTGCSMNWYSIKTPEVQKTTKKTVINTRYIQYHIKEVDIIESTVLKSPSLVNIGIPHNVKNKNEHRWCISFVYTFKDSGRRPTMEESLKLFNDYLF
jgi:hypothetical protein